MPQVLNILSGGMVVLLSSTPCGVSVLLFLWTSSLPTLQILGGFFFFFRFVVLEFVNLWAGGYLTVRNAAILLTR